MQITALRDKIIYGLVNSRRLGSSLGINLMPTEYKVCPFNCVYCHWGFTEVVTDTSRDIEKDLPGPEAVEEVLEKELHQLSQPGGGRAFIRVIEGKVVESQERSKPLYITFSGTGEATLHPQFDQIVEKCRVLQKKYFPQAKLAILSNSALVSRKEVREALEKLDVRIMKLDTGDEKLFRKINGPFATCSLESIVEGLRELKDVTIQTIFMQGLLDNSTPEAVSRWIERLKDIQPREVQIYSVDRIPALKGIEKVSKERLHEIAQEAEEKTGITVKVY